MNPLWIPKLIGALIVALLVGAIYYAGYTHGSSKSEVASLVAQIDYRKSVDATNARIEGTLHKIASKSDNTKLAEDMAILIKNAKKQPSVIYKDGACVPSPAFVNSINAAVDRVNSK